MTSPFDLGSQKCHIHIFQKTASKDLERPLEAVEVSYFEVAEDACISVGPLKATSFYDF